MSHAYVSNLVHCIFGTKDRMPMIDLALEERLWPYIGGIARENKMKALAIGGTSDHLHALLSMPPSISISKGLQLIKGGSSKWIHDTFREAEKFAWQGGYGAFSIGVSQVERTIAYINNQKEHHRKRTSREEIMGFLDWHSIEYDSRYI